MENYSPSMSSTTISSITARQIILPCGEGLRENTFNAEVYNRFMGHLRCVPISRMEIKILSSIQFTADMEDLSDAHVSKMLVEMGLRAPRISFPLEFLEYSDASMMRQGWAVGAPSRAMIELRQYWLCDHREAGAQENMARPVTSCAPQKDLVVQV